MDIVLNKSKRERSANFSMQERDILIALVQKYQNVLENKQSDATTWKKKEAAWSNIQSEFNARSGGIFRCQKTLKVKYEGLKRSVRKKSAAIRSELYRTGGGKNTAPPLDSVEEQIKTMITLSTDGLESVCDSDVLPQTQENCFATNSMEDFIEIIPMNTESEVILGNEATQTQIPPIEEICILNEENILPATSAETVTENDDKSRLSEKFDLTTTPSLTNKQWDVTSRRNLKLRKHPALTANLQKKSHFEELTQAKLELTQLQKELLEAEIIEKKKEWEFNEKERKWKEEEYKLKLEILRKELNK